MDSSEGRIGSEQLPTEQVFNIDPVVQAVALDPLYDVRVRLCETAIQACWMHRHPEPGYSSIRRK
jgi:hypothetical protein